MEIYNKTDLNLPIFFDFIKNIDDNSLHNAQIESLYICNEQNYRFTVKQIDSIQDVTNNGNYIGYGKTIYKNEKNSIIIRDIIAQIINKQYVNVSEIKALDIGVQCAYRLVFHEIGHAFDNCKREIKIEQPDECGEYFKLRDFLNYYFLNITCEYNAECFVRNIVSIEYKKNAINCLTEDYNIMRKLFDENKITYKNDIENHAKSNIVAFYQFLSQYATLLSLTSDSTIINDFLRFANKYFLNTIDWFLLDDIFTQSTIPDSLLELCLLNFESYGFRFVINKTGADSFFSIKPI